MIIGLDVGGTHTDAVLLDDTGPLKEIKVPTDHRDLLHTVTTGLDQVMADIDPQQVQRLVLSTTLTTNAVVQKQLAPVGMIVSSGPGIDPALFRTNAHYHVVAGSIDHRGREVQPIDGDEIHALAQALQAADIRYIGVVGKFSVRNPSHEQQIADLLNNHFEKIFMGHHLSGHLNFPRRIATTHLNAAVYPVHKKFFTAVKQSLAAKGLRIPIRVLKADGGNTRFTTSIDSPGQTVFSGPAASIIGSVGYAAPGTETVVLDIGGTTTDMAVLIDRAPLLAARGVDAGPHKTLIRALDTTSIGLGGDSAVRVVDGDFQIGPRRRGPAMAFGGPVPTPTDALLVLKKLDTGDHERAREGIGTLAGQLDQTPEEAAAGIFDCCCRLILEAIDHMVAQINSKPVYTVHELRDGHRAAPRELLVLGGPAPHFAERLEQLSDYTVRVVPKWHVANAIGAALARTTSEVTLFADTEQKTATAPEENFNKKIDGGYDRQAALTDAFDLLRDKAIRHGAQANHLEMEAVETQEFNMVRGFRTIGKNIRVKVQIKPGLMHGYAKLLES